MIKAIIKKITFLLLTTCCLEAVGQDLHYADVQTMNLWYNQALKMERAADIRFNFRDIKYQSLLAFRTASGMINVPLVKKENRDDYGKSFLSATAAGAFDKSSRGVFKNNTGMLGLSYAQRLTENQTFLSVGFQGTSTSTSLGTFGSLFPDQFDQFGPLPSATRDPLRAGRSYNWMSLNTGAAVFQNTEYKEWYVGASVRHINRPFTDEQKTSEYRLAPTWGMQAGLTVKSENDQIGVYGILNFKAQAHEYLVGARFAKTIDEGDERNEGSSIGFGVAFRVRDAVIPNLQLKMNKTVLGFHYDMNISGLKAAGYSRQGFEVSVSQKLN
jgi:type IX secretion system PorP/SprF family membrane protein